MSKAKSKKNTQVKEFSIKTDNPRILKGVIETLANIVDEIELEVSTKGLFISAMDASHICLMRLEMSKTDFDELKCKGMNKIGISAEDLDKILKRSTKEDTLEVFFNEKEQKIKIKMAREGRHLRTFSLVLQDTDIENVSLENLEKMEYETRFNIDSLIFTEALKDAEIYSEILNIQSTEETLILSSLGIIGEMIYELSAEDLIDCQLCDEAPGSYAIQFLKAISKLSSIIEKLEIFFKTGLPLKMVFSLLEGGTLKYWVSPRVEEQEFDEEDDVDFEEDDDNIEKED